MGTVWAMKALSVAGAEVQFNQSITFHSLVPFVFPLTLTFSLTEAAALDLMPGFTFQHSSFSGSHPVAGREPRR